MKEQATVTVPASSGNIGPGFDVLGLALNFRNELHVRILRWATGEPYIRIVGEGDGSLPVDSKNVIYKTMVGLFARARKPIPQLEITCVNRIPLARGLGSSSAAYLCGLLAANRLLANKYTLDEILNFASELEGHPDNVAPALFGGVRASGVFQGRVVSAAFPTPALKCVAAIPSFELATKKARAVLPSKVPLKDAVHNLSSVALLSYAFEENDGRLLGQILNDRLHEPYRAPLVPGFLQVKNAAIGAGAYGVTLSGAGPTMMAFVPRLRGARVALAMKNAFKRAGVQSTVRELEIDKKGASVQ